MATTHTVLFTVMPRGLTLNPQALPLSIVVSPRLVGGARLGEFPDWVDWTQKLTAGLPFVLQCGGRTARVDIDTSLLRPDLWQALFNEGTFVRSRVFNDYSEHGVMSFSVRETLSALKAVYQEAGVVLAVPDPEDDRDPFAPRDQFGRHGLVEPPRTTNRMRLTAMLEGLDVHWSGRRARELRALARHRSLSGTSARAINGNLDAEGLITAARNPDAFSHVAGPFSAYHHMPTPTEEQGGAVTVDPDDFDFHQALSALEAHPALLRALGLVFDVDVPLDLVPASPSGAPENVSVQSAHIAWQVPPATRPLETACLHLAAGETRLFTTASRSQSKAPGPMQVFGLLNLDPNRFGLAQVDVDGAMHKVITTAEIYNHPDPERSLLPADPDPAPNPEVFDPEATLPSMRSAGFQLYLDGRGAATLDAITQSKKFQEALESGGVHRPFHAEDLVRGYRLDIWDSHSNEWHSLHRRSGDYRIGDHKRPFHTADEEGFFQLAATQSAPGAPAAEKDLYVHEVIARWAGWSLSVPFPGLALSRFADPEKALPEDPNDPDFASDEPITAFKVRAEYKVALRSLPALRVGRRYRIRARAVDLAGNSLTADAPVGHALALVMGLPRGDADGQPYLRYDPVAAPQVVIRDEAAVTGPGSASHRLVLRTFNDSPERDGIAAKPFASDRHILPPRTSVQMAEHLGMLDGADGRLNGDAATYGLAVARDAGQLNQETFDIAGKEAKGVPIERGASVDALPYLPDPLARGAAIRNLPGTPSAAIGRAAPDDPAEGPVAYTTLTDINPRPGSATLISFNTTGDWQQTTGFRLALGELAAGDTDARPRWDPAARALTVFLSKGHTAVVPLASYLLPSDLKLMGQWQWLREFVDLVTLFAAQPAHLLPGLPVDLIAHVLQRAAEGGHWLLTPPTLLTLVHAVQQPIGRPAFAALNVRHADVARDVGLQLDRMRGRTDPQELAPITAWRRLGGTSAYLMGALRVHGVSTAKVNLFAEWTDPVDDSADIAGPSVQPFSAAVDELPIPRPREGYLAVPAPVAGADPRRVGYYDPEHDQIAMVRYGDHAGPASGAAQIFVDAAPRHEFNDTKHHTVRYRATASSRYREYFDQKAGLDFTRTSDEVVVDVPASDRPRVPEIVYVVPTFGWQRQTDTNMKRSIRYGGGLRVYLKRGWFSSGEGELLGVALWNSANGTLDVVTRDRFKACFTQWGMDPIWQTGALKNAPGIRHFPDAVASDRNVTLDEDGPRRDTGEPGLIDVVGFAPQYDPERRLWFADLTIDVAGDPSEFITHATYAPFIRLALVRYQPHALDDARVSPVVLAGFSQLTPDRAAIVTADPYHPRTLRINVSGVAPSGPLPTGPAPEKPARPTHVNVRVQKRADGGRGELDWIDAPADVTVTQLYEGPGLYQPNLGLWWGTVTFAAAPEPDAYRVVVEEFEYISATYAEGRQAPGRLIYAETFLVDAALVKQ